jgi:hypothetical protein
LLNTLQVHFLKTVDWLVRENTCTTFFTSINIYKHKDFQKKAILKINVLAQLALCSYYFYKIWSTGLSFHISHTILKSYVLQRTHACTHTTYIHANRVFHLKHNTNYNSICKLW